MCQKNNLKQFKCVKRELISAICVCRVNLASVFRTVTLSDLDFVLMVFKFLSVVILWLSFLVIVKSIDHKCPSQLSKRTMWFYSPFKHILASLIFLSLFLVHVLDHEAAARPSHSQRLQPQTWRPAGFWYHQWTRECVHVHYAQSSINTS